MNPSTARALDRVLRQMSRPPRARKTRFSTAPIVLALGLVVGYQLTARLVPKYWAAMLPGGLDQARFFRGWPGLLWASSVRCHLDFPGSAGLLAAIGASGFFLSTFVRPLRPVVWLMVAGTIAIDAGIVYVMIRTALEATARNAGIM